jgi:hypothetical protein
MLLLLSASHSSAKNTVTTVRSNGSANTTLRRADSSNSCVCEGRIAMPEKRGNMKQRETKHILQSVCALVFAFVILTIGSASLAQVAVSITIAPPALPVYQQPPCPSAGYIWTPGYWAYGPDGYFWVPGTWVEVPAAGLLWTPGYWGWNNGVYVWNTGY